MIIRRSPDIQSSEITPEALYWDRRRFIRMAAGAGAAALVSSTATRLEAAEGSEQGGDEPTPFEDVTTYNNFYEFGTDKADPSENAHTLRPRPWTVVVEGEVHKPKTYGIDELLTGFSVQERVYRMR